jgi:hypothetical protein
MHAGKLMLTDGLANDHNADKLYSSGVMHKINQTRISLKM